VLQKKSSPLPARTISCFRNVRPFLVAVMLKARDAFDIHLLLTRGAQLANNLQAHLEDFITMKEIERESIETRIQNIDAKLCTVELRPVLPQAVFDDLAKNEFETIRDSLRIVFSHWPGKVRQ